MIYRLLIFLLVVCSFPLMAGAQDASLEQIQKKIDGQDYNGALALIDEVLLKDPANIEVQEMKINLLVKQEREKDAMKDIERFLFQYRITSYNVCYTKLLRYLTDAVTSSPQGWLGFAGERVMVTFHPDSIVLRSGKRKPDIVQVHYMDKQQTINRKLYGEDSLTIVSSSSWIGFDCTVLDFLAPDKNYYQYSLVPEGEADRWVNLGNKRTFYESLANNGYYHLKVRTLDREMQWASDYRNNFV